VQHLTSSRAALRELPFGLANVAGSMVLGTFFFAVATGACAQSTATAPSPTPTPRPLGLQLSGTLETTFVDQNTAGPGQIAPEAAGFRNGSPLSPNTPYDLLSSAPLTPGVAGIGQSIVTAAFRTPALNLTLTGGLGYVNGSVTNASYWGENLIPALNPHMGSQALPYAIVFPTAPGQDDAIAFRASILGGSIATADGNLVIKGGYFDLTQTNRFVFVQPALTSVNPAIAYAPAESLSSGLAGSDIWQPLAALLPLDGIDIVGKRGLATLEVSNAALPSLPGTSARATIGSLFIEHRDGTRYSIEMLHAQTSGAAFTTTTPFGADPMFLPTPQGLLPTSILSGQQQTILGFSTTFHLMPAWKLNAAADVGRAWYGAQGVALPGTSAPGGYYHLGLVKTLGRATAQLDLYRMDARYATMLLPYGVPENQWSAAFAWPGQWLKSDYQLVDNSVLGVNRQGYRLRYFVDGGPLEVRTEFTDLRQIDPETTITSEYTGFVDGFYLPQLPANATLGAQQRYALWIAWHPRFGDLTLDMVDDELARPAVAAADAVDCHVPQAVLTYARHVSPNVLGALGMGRFGMQGTYSEPLGFGQRLYFAGAIVRESSHASLLMSLRRTIFSGTAASTPPFASPDFTGTQLIVEQRYQM
jgi:hypothetical protein